MIEDVIAQSRRHIVELEPASAEDVRQAGRPIIGFSPAMAAADRAIKGFLYPRLYRHARIVRIMDEAEALLGRLFEHYVATPGDLPPEWIAGLDPANAAGRALRVADFMAGMTDRYAMVEHARLFGSTLDLS
jgi:dGTPase